MNLTITQNLNSKRQTFGFNFDGNPTNTERAFHRNGGNKDITRASQTENPLKIADTEADRIVKSFADAVVNETKTGAMKINATLEHLQALLGGIQSGKPFESFTASTKLDILRRAVTRTISNLKP